MNREIDIDGTMIGQDNKPYIIAEIGLNHNKNMDLTKKMIDAAKESGANAVKFQTYQTEKLLLETSGAYSLFKNLELSKTEFREISEHCKKTGITFFSAPFSFESVDLLEELNVPCYKIASMELNYYDLIEYIARKNKPVILSTGMGSINEIDRAVEIIENCGNDKIIILHCISKYPPEPEDMNMRLITKLSVLYPDYPVGFSDHTPDDTMAVAALALGARVFEKHFTLDKDLDGPDHKISSTPAELKKLKVKLDNTESALKFTKERKDSEIAVHARRSLFASRDIKKGEKIDRSMVLVVRPGDGLPPEMLTVISGKYVNRDIKKGEKIELSFF
jgi:N,N'-diacetyllegionaminate synthase